MISRKYYRRRANIKIKFSNLFNNLLLFSFALLHLIVYNLFIIFFVLSLSYLSDIFIEIGKYKV